MLGREEILPKANIYSSKILFHQINSRNRKRIEQILKMKSIISTKKKLLNTNYQKLPQSCSPIRPQNEEKISQLLIINVSKEDEININNSISTHYYGKKEKEKEINLLNKNLDNSNDNIKVDCSSPLSNNIMENNYYNNSSTNNNSNNSIFYKDYKEKEINISNLDDDSIKEIIVDKNNNQENEYNNNKILKKNNIYNYYKYDDNLLNKEEQRLKEENEFALKYLCSSSESFIQFDNNLVAKAKAQEGDITESYFQALFPQISYDANKCSKNKNYEVDEIIKEEKEIETPSKFKNASPSNSNVNYKRKGKNMEINFNNFNISYNGEIKDFKKYSNKNSIIKINKSHEYKNRKFKSNIKQRNTKKIIKKNNTITNIKKNIINLKKSYLNKDFSLSNKNIIINRINNLEKKINNKSVSISIYKDTRTGYKLNKNIQKKIHLKKFNKKINIQKKEKELNDILINNYIKNVYINKTTNLKIIKKNEHYWRNINNYQKFNLNYYRKKITKINKDENNLNKLNSIARNNFLNTLNSSKESCLKNDIYSIYNNSCKDISRTKNFLSKINISSKYLINNYNINNSKKMDLLHKKVRINKEYKLFNILKRSKTCNKSYNKINISENVLINSINIKDNNHSLNNTLNNNTLAKIKITPFNMKKDYSFIKNTIHIKANEFMKKRMLYNNKKFSKPIIKKMKIFKKNYY